MKVIVTAAALLLAGAAQGQTPPAQPAPAPPASNLTRDLNSGPPAPAVYLAPAPVAVAEPEAVPVTSAAPAVPTPRATPAPPLAAITTPTPGSAPNSAPTPTTAPPARVVAPTPVLPPSAPFTLPPGGMPPRITPIPTTPTPQPRMVPITPPGSALPTPTPPPSVPFTPPGSASAPAPTVPLEAVVAPPPPPAAPAVTVLDSAARAALPFTADLPPGFELVTGRPGPDFRIYTIRRGPQSFVMVYAGPASQFPIYSGQMVEAGGRASILSTEDGVRHAVEHLFQRAATPREIHVWTMSLDGADRDLAEQIAQSVDVR